MDELMHPWLGDLRAEDIATVRVLSRREVGTARLGCVHPALEGDDGWVATPAFDADARGAEASRDWLDEHLPTSSELLMLWNDRGIAIPRALVVREYDRLWLPSSDDVVLLDALGRGLVVMDHERVFTALTRPAARDGGSPDDMEAIAAQAVRVLRKQAQLASGHVLRRVTPAIRSLAVEVSVTGVVLRCHVDGPTVHVADAMERGCWLMRRELGHVEWELIRCDAPTPIVVAGDVIYRRKEA